MRVLTRRAFGGVLAVVAIALSRWFGESIVSRDDDQIVIVNGWVVKKSDFGPHDR